LSALAAQFFHARSDRSEIVSSAGSALAAQLLHARSDCRKIVSGAGSRHVSSVLAHSGYNILGQAGVSAPG